MIIWKPLTTLRVLEELGIESYHRPVFIFKHSTRCNISSIAKMRLEDQWNSKTDQAASFYVLDVIANRDLSSLVAQQFEIYHESPQILVIIDGECTHDASHFDITADELREVV